MYFWFLFLSHAAYIQGFQAGSLATQAKFHAKMQQQAQPESPAALDFENLNMSGSPALGSMENASASRSSGQQPLGYDQQLAFDHQYVNGEQHGVPMRSAPIVPPLQTNWQDQSGSTSQPRSSYGWPAPAEHWGNSMSPSAAQGSSSSMDQQQRNGNKFPFVFENGFDRRRRGA
jgi:hypothetical protein